MPRGKNKPEKCKACNTAIEQPLRGRTRERCDECSYKQKLRQDRERQLRQRIGSEFMFMPSISFHDTDKLHEKFRKKIFSRYSSKKLQTVNNVPHYIASSNVPEITFYEIDYSEANTHKRRTWSQDEIVGLIDDIIYILIETLNQERKLKK